MKFKICLLLLFVSITAAAQNQIKLLLVDHISKEPLVNASVKIRSNGQLLMSNNQGELSLLINNTETVEVSCIGYNTFSFLVDKNTRLLSLVPASNTLQDVVISANRTIQKRSEAPVAISIINKQAIEESKAQRLDFLLNKVSGVFMVNLGNEQHQMSIRQPMTTKSLFLYMEDGIPIRTTGVYNHNALLELNLPAAKSIEVIKGPSSALYGAEAIGGAVNIITQAAPAFTTGKISVQLNDKGYKRVDAQAGTAFKKLGVIASGYYADKRNGPIEYSDFRKAAFNIRTDYKASEKTNWTNTFSLVDYNSDMSGSIDSIKFTQKNYTSQQTFTYRKVKSLRYKSMLTQQWNKNSNTSVAFLFRKNRVEQNPSYSIGSTSNPTKFKGQINSNDFKTFALFVNHAQKFNWLQSKVVAGVSIDNSPQQYYAKFISITKDLASGKFVSYTTPATDSFLSKYKTGILNMAAYIDYEMSPFKNFKLVMALRYDAFRYDFVNQLPASASVSTASTVNNFSRITPKVGFTYNHKGIGVYANYSEGYVPPQLTELYSSVKVAPYLAPQNFSNYEVGGWAQLLKEKIYIDWSLYWLNGSNEIISVKQPDNTSVNENAGSTRHTGIEYGITYKPLNGLSIRFSATNAKHMFVNNVVKGVNYSGKEMSGASRFICNAEVSWKPAFVKGLRLGAEWQHQNKYFMDDLNMYSYKGFDVFNIRAGYQWKGFELWVNVINAGNLYYSTFSSKNATVNGNSAYSYSLGDPREITVGLAYQFGTKK